MRLLNIEDERELADVLSKILVHQGHGRAQVGVGGLHLVLDPEDDRRGQRFDAESTSFRQPQPFALAVPRR